jgi:hypothetical protein
MCLVLSRASRRRSAMDRARLLIMPLEHSTQLLARSAMGAVLLRARLPAPALHSEALPMLLDALASFVPLRAALVVPDRAPSLATRLYPDWFTDVGDGRYDLQTIRSGRRELRRWWGR